MNKKILEHLFLVREQAYQRSTDDILKEIRHVIDGVVGYLHLNDDLSQGNLSWQNVQLDSEILVLMGLVEYPPGSKFTTSQGEDMVVDADNQEYFKRIIRIGLPQRLVETGTKEQVIEFMHSVNNQMEEAELDNEEILTAATKILFPDVVGITEFDLSDLTEEQKQAIILAGEGKVH